ncbi:MAG: hypothetical protein G8345_22225 [Magnetococcales bacterium]|nr:hypothetical protein [Magnetococcales bacterium]
MSPDDRLTEVAAILATGVRRLLKKRETEKISLDKSPKTRPYVRKTNQLGERT